MRRRGRVGGCWQRVGLCVMGDQVETLAAELPVLVTEWRRALARRNAAIRHRDAALARANRRVQAALGDLTLRRFRTLTSAKASLRSHRAARATFVARKRAPAVAAALESLVSVELAEQDQVNSADMALANATVRLLKFGPAAADLTGKSMSKLRRMAHSAGGTTNQPLRRL